MITHIGAQVHKHVLRERICESADQVGDIDCKETTPGNLDMGRFGLRVPMLIGKHCVRKSIG